MELCSIYCIAELVSSEVQETRPFHPCSDHSFPSGAPLDTWALFPMMQLQSSLINCQERMGLCAVSSLDTQQLFLGAVGPSEGDLTRSSCVHSILNHHWHHQIQASIMSHLNHYSNLLATLLLPSCILQFIFHIETRIIILKPETNFKIF